MDAARSPEAEVAGIVSLGDGKVFERTPPRASLLAVQTPQCYRREVLAGLSTVPALGLFGYAWSRQHQYQQAKVQAAAPAAAAADVRELNVALIGAGAQGQVLTDAMLRIPGLRFRAVCDIWTEYNLKRAGNLLRKYGPNWMVDYADVVHRRLRSWGLNTLANCSKPAIYLQRKTPYTATVYSLDSPPEDTPGGTGYVATIHDDSRVIEGSSGRLSGTRGLGPSSGKYTYAAPGRSRATDSKCVVLPCPHAPINCTTVCGRVSGSRHRSHSTTASSAHSTGDSSPNGLRHRCGRLASNSTKSPASTWYMVPSIRYSNLPFKQ